MTITPSQFGRETPPLRSEPGLRRWYESARSAAIRLATIAGIFVLASGVPIRAQGFSDQFTGYTIGGSLDSLQKWSASSAVTVGGSASDPYVKIVIDPLNPTGFMKPWINYSGGWEKAHWPVTRTGDRFLRFEFDVASPTILPNGRMLVMLDSKATGPGLPPPDNNLGYGDYGPLLVVEFNQSTNPPVGVTQFSANVYAQAAPGSALAGATQINLGTISSTMRKMRIDFGWDYFILPRSFTGPVQPSRGEPWFYVRLSYFDAGTGTWVQPYARPSHGNGETDGWVEFGDETMASVSGMNLSGKIAIYRYDWKSAGVYDPVYTYWHFDRIGSNNMTWRIDNVSIDQIVAPSFSVMTNQVGYDAAGPQWAVVRVNDPTLLGNPSIVTRVDWSLTGTGITTQSQTLNYPPGVAEACFREPNDPDDFVAKTRDFSSGYNLPKDYWWRWEWIPVRASATGCIVTATVYTLSGTSTITSDPFSISPGLAYSTLVANPTNNIAAFNALQRKAVNTIHSIVPPNGPSGWFDANAENGENRAIGSFITALSTVLRRRRPEMPTSETTATHDQIIVGADFLQYEGGSENQAAAAGSRSHQTNTGNKNDEAHDFDPASAIWAKELAGHIWHESALRENGRGSDSADQDNSPSKEWMSCVGLLDAARALQPYGDSQTAGYVAQAAATRDYIESLAAAKFLASDYYYTNRARAMLDFIDSEVEPGAGGFNAAVAELAIDLDSGGPIAPITVDDVQRFWIMGGQFNLSSGASVDIGGIDPAVYCAADPILYCIEHGVANQPPPALTWWQAMNNIIDLWYDSTSYLRSGSLHPNPLRITNNWTPAVALEDYYGQFHFKDKLVALEGYTAARFARTLGRNDARFDRLVQLATGDLNYLLGMNIGVRHHHVLHTVGSAATDFEYVGASLINAAGTRWAAQTLHPTEYHVWSQVTTMSGPGGSAVLNGNDETTDWEVGPFEHARGITGEGAETFIKHDANVIMLAEELDRTLHPKLVVEAETGSSVPPLTSASNNLPPLYMNGGVSVPNIVSGRTITYSSLMSPEPLMSPAHSFRFRVRLRASNTGSVPCTVSVSVTQGTYNWSDTISVPVTSNTQDYVVVNNAKGYYVPSPLTLASNSPFTVVLSVGGSGLGPCAFDDFVLESEGVPR